MQHDGIRLRQAGKEIGRDRHPARRDDDRPDESTADFFANGLDAGSVVLFDAGVPRKNNIPKDAVLLIPEPEQAGMQPAHGVKPGYYNSKQMLQLLNLHKDDADAIHIIADMLETGDADNDGFVQLLRQNHHAPAAITRIIQICSS
jgi:hypothetical protein